jgi:hypothetical protein
LDKIAVPPGRHYPVPRGWGLVLHQRMVRCVECRRVWRFPNSEGWRAFWIDDGPEEKLLFYCPGCSEREFGRH